VFGQLHGSPSKVSPFAGLQQAGRTARCLSSSWPRLTRPWQSLATRSPDKRSAIRGSTW